MNSPTQVFQEVLGYSRDLEGYSAGDVIKELAPFVNGNNIQEFVDNLEAIARVGDSFTVTEVLESAEGVVISRSQGEQISSVLCRFVGDKKEAGNIKAMEYSLNNMARNKFELKLANQCL